MLTGLSDKYKCQQATRINNKHLQTNIRKYNITQKQNMVKPKTKHGGQEMGNIFTRTISTFSHPGEIIEQ